MCNCNCNSKCDSDANATPDQIKSVIGNYITNRSAVVPPQEELSHLSNIVSLQPNGLALYHQTNRLTFKEDEVIQSEVAFGNWKMNKQGKISLITYDYDITAGSQAEAEAAGWSSADNGEYNRYLTTLQLQANGDLKTIETRILSVLAAEHSDPLEIVSYDGLSFKYSNKVAVRIYKKMSAEPKYFGPIPGAPAGSPYALPM